MRKVGRAIVVAGVLLASLLLCAATAEAQTSDSEVPEELIFIDPSGPLPPGFVVIEPGQPLPADFFEGVPPKYRFLVDPSLPVPAEFAFLDDPRLPVPPEYEFFFDPRLPVPKEFEWLFGPDPGAVPQQIAIEPTPIAVDEPVAPRPTTVEIIEIPAPAETDVEPAAEATDQPVTAPGITIVPNTVVTAQDGARSQLTVPTPPSSSGMPVPLLVFVAVATLALAATIPFFLRQRSGSEAALRELALTDDLTKLANRRRLDRDLANHQRAETPVAVAMLDIDHFKRLNDDFGHATGDVVLQRVAALISQNVRADDVVYRYGGEEFCVLMPGVTELEAAAVVDRVRGVVAHHGFEPLDRQVTISVGVAVESATTGQEAMRRADAALYAAKNAGRNRVTLSSHMPD